MDAKELTLRVVPLGDAILHEQVERTRVERLAARLRKDRLLKNPPIVAHFDGKYVVLDGASRVTALRQIAARDVVVQIVDYDSPELTLETWNHMLLDFPVDALFEALGRVPGLKIEATSVDGAEAALDKRESIASILLPNGEVFSLCATSEQLEDQARVLNEVVATYDGRGAMYRVAHTDVERLLAEHGRLSALVVFPRYRPDEIRRLALSGSKLPMGITRHIIPGRALRLNIPLDLLERDAPLEEKNAWLDRWVEDRLLEHHVRYYQEPVFLFDE